MADRSDRRHRCQNCCDAFGNQLNGGDSVTVIKDLKIKGSSLLVKVGTKVRTIRIVEGDHDIDCKIEGIGARQLKSEFAKKAWRPELPAALCEMVPFCEIL